MANVVVLGAQWGDEGKGKIVDVYTERAGLVVRYQGGHNAGHTVVVGKERFILHLIPSGILHPDKVCVIGNGVVVSPEHLLREMDALIARDVSLSGRFFISDRANVLMPYHAALDLAREEKRGARAIGTTGRGIGPAYEDKVARTGIRMGDLLHPETFREQLAAALEIKNFLLEKYHGKHVFDMQQTYEHTLALAERLKPHIADTVDLLHKHMAAGHNTLFEGAQGSHLDVDHGTYPYVTSSSTVAGGACTGAGVGPKALDAIVGIAKAYTTRVGGGPFPVELNDDIGNTIREKGKEYGATTGRPRRCGWFDAAAVRQSGYFNGLTHLVLTKLDVLDGLASLKICTGYDCGGRRLRLLPSDLGELETCRPIYEEHRGWSRPTAGLKRWEDLPKEAQSYVRRIEELTEVPVAIVSTGQERTQNIELKDPWK